MVIREYKFPKAVYVSKNVDKAGFALYENHGVNLPERKEVVVINNKLVKVIGYKIDTKTMITYILVENL